MMVNSGVFVFGVFGPNAAIELGQKNLFILYVTAKSSIIFNHCKLISRARFGSFSQVADNKLTK
jgi:hypothetical protein